MNIWHGYHSYIFIKFFTAEQNDFTKTKQEQNDFMETIQEQNDFMETDQEQNDFVETNQEQYSSMKTNSMEPTQISNSSVPCTKPDIPVIKLEKTDCDHTYESSSNLKYDSKKSPKSSTRSKKSSKFHSCFLRKLSQNKVSNVNCNHLLLADPKVTVYWSDYLTKINCKFPNVIQACHITKFLLMR